MADFTVEGIIDVDASRGIRGIKKFKSELKGLMNDLRAAGREIDKLDRKSVNIDVKADTEAIKKLRSDLDRIKDETVEVNIRVDDEVHDLAQQVEQIKKSVDAMGDAEIGVDLDADEAITDAIKLREEIEAITADDVEFKVQMANASQAIADAHRLRTEVERLVDNFDSEFDFDLSLGGVAKATADVGKFKDACAAATRTVGWGKVGLVGGLTLLASTIGPMSASLAGLAGGMVSSMSVMGIAVGSFAAFAVPTIKEITEGFKLLTTDTSSLSPEKLEEFNKKLADLKKNSPKIYEAAKALKALKDEYMELVKEMRPIVLDAFANGLDALRVIMKGLFPVAKEAGKAIRDLLSSATKNLKGDEWQAFFKYLKNNAREFVTVWGKTIGNFITGIANMIRAFHPLTKWVNGGFLGMSKSFRNWSNSLKDNEGFKSFVSYVKTNTPIIWNAFKNIGKAIYLIFKELAPIGEAVFKNINRFTDWIKKNEELRSSFGELMDKLGPLLEKISEIVFKVLDDLSPVFTEVMDNLGKVAEAVSPLLDELQKLWDMVSPVLIPVLKFLADILGGALVGAIEGITTMFKGLNEVIGGFKEIFSGIKDIFSGDFKEGFKKIFGGLLSIVVGALKMIWGAIKTWFNVTVLGLFKRAGLKLVGSWKGAWTKIKEWGKKSIDWIVKKIKSFGGKIKETWNRIWTAVKTKFKSIWDGIKGVAGRVWGWLKEKVSSAFGKIKEKIKSTLSNTKEVWSRIWGSIKEKLASIWNTMKEKVSNSIGRIMEIIRGIPGKVKDAFANAGKWLWDAGKNIIDGLIGGITSKFGAVKDKLGSLTSSLTDWKGPKTVDKKLLRPSGHWIMEGLIGGIDDKEGELFRQLTSLTNSIAMLPFEDLGGTIKGAEDAGSVAAGSLGGGRTVIKQYNIDVKVPIGTNLAQAGKEITKAIDAFENSGGKRRKR